LRPPPENMHHRRLPSATTPRAPPPCDAGRAAFAPNKTRAREILGRGHPRAPRRGRAARRGRVRAHQLEGKKSTTPTSRPGLASWPGLGVAGRRSLLFWPGASTCFQRGARAHQLDHTAGLPTQVGRLPGAWACRGARACPWSHEPSQRRTCNRVKSTVPCPNSRMVAASLSSRPDLRFEASLACSGSRAHPLVVLSGEKTAPHTSARRRARAQHYMDHW
jgi:hypothetical protein